MSTEMIVTPGATVDVETQARAALDALIAQHNLKHNARLLWWQDEDVSESIRCTALHVTTTRQDVARWSQVLGVAVSDEHTVFDNKDGSWSVGRYWTVRVRGWLTGVTLAVHATDHLHSALPPRAA